MDLTTYLLLSAIMSIVGYHAVIAVPSEKKFELRDVQEFGARLSSPTKRDSYSASLPLHQTFYTSNTNTDIHPQTHFDDIQIIFHPNPRESYPPLNNAIDGPAKPAIQSHTGQARPRAPSAMPIVTPYQNHDAQQQPTPDIGYIDLKVLQTLNPQPLRAIFIRNFGMPVSLGSGALGYAALPNGLIILGSGSLGYTALAGSGLRMRGKIPGAPPNNMARMGNGLTQHFGFDLHT